MTGHPLTMIADKLALHPDLTAGLTCSIGLLQNFPRDPAATILIALDVDMSRPQSAAWKLYRLLSGKEADRDK
jgi:hypothetical protein